jgi:hypothetical protein
MGNIWTLPKKIITCVSWFKIKFVGLPQWGITLIGIKPV